MTAPGALPSRRRFGAPKNWRDTFITTLAETSNVSAAALAADISPSWVYKTRREDRSFAKRWFAALCEGYDNLEMATLHRLLHGAEDGDRKFDVTNALRMLAAHRTAVAREKARTDDEDEETILAAINAKLAAMRARERAIVLLLADGRGADEPDDD